MAGFVSRTSAHERIWKELEFLEPEEGGSLISLPTLHVMGETDRVIERVMSDHLQGHFLRSGYSWPRSGACPFTCTSSAPYPTSPEPHGESPEPYPPAPSPCVAVHPGGHHVPATGDTKAATLAFLRDMQVPWSPGGSYTPSQEKLL